MTTINQAREAIYQQFATAWAATGKAYCFANERFTPPVGDGWARATVIHATGDQDSLGGIGSRKFVRRGIVIVQVFTPLDEGHTSSDTLVTAARAALEGLTLTPPVWLYSTDVQEVGPSDGWFQVNLTTDFAYEETK